MRFLTCFYPQNSVMIGGQRLAERAISILLIHAFQWKQYPQVYTFYATQLLYLHTKETSNDSTPLLTLPAQQFEGS